MATLRAHEATSKRLWPRTHSARSAGGDGCPRERRHDSGAGNGARIHPRTESCPFVSHGHRLHRPSVRGARVAPALPGRCARCGSRPTRWSPREAALLDRRNHPGGHGLVGGRAARASPAVSRRGPRRRSGCGRPPLQPNHLSGRGAMGHDDAVDAGGFVGRGGTFGGNSERRQRLSPCRRAAAPGPGRAPALHGNQRRQRRRAFSPELGLLVAPARRTADVCMAQRALRLRLLPVRAGRMAARPGPVRLRHPLSPAARGRHLAQRRGLGAGGPRDLPGQPQADRGRGLHQRGSDHLDHQPLADGQ